MRIITGQFKGCRLGSFSSKTIRPMTDRVKVAVFDILNSYISFSSQRVLDLFSGTGNLAFESLSRGAREVILVDSGRSFLSIIDKNIQLLKISKGVKIYHRDVFRFLSFYGKHTKTSQSRVNPLSFGLIFADPPFSKHWGLKILDYLSRSKVMHNNTLLVLETSTQEKTFTSHSFWHLFFEKKFRDKKVLFYRWEGFK